MRVPSKMYSYYQAMWRPLFAPFTSGMNIYERDWDLLVVLDGCRVDTLTQVAPSFDFINEVESVRSVGSQSKEWLAKTFVPDWRTEIRKSTYLTANVFTDEVFGESKNDRRTNPANWKTVDRNTFEELVELWRSEWDTELDTVPPRRVTDAAIATARERRPARLIVHYMQPHEPFIGGEDPIHSVWEKIRSNELQLDAAREGYRKNLELVLEEVELLVTNVDAPKTVITSDHGNAFGEWGIYGHPIGFPHPVVKRVPWVETESIDTNTHTPDWDEQAQDDNVNVQRRLEALGYR